jgi:hypothetical protein
LKKGTRKEEVGKRGDKESFVDGGEDVALEKKKQDTMEDTEDAKEWEEDEKDEKLDD